MKWIAKLLPLVAALTLGYSTHAQNIDFSNLTIAQARAKARREHKPLLIDFYTTWSTPSKQLEQTVYADPRVVGLLNKHFIAVRMDAERQELSAGRSLQIKAFPTLLFYDADGRLIARPEGPISVEEFLERAQATIDFDKLKDKFSRNPQNRENTYRYARALSWTNMTEARQTAAKFLRKVDTDDLGDPFNWQLIKAFIDATDRHTYPRVAGNAKLFSIYGADYQAYLLRTLRELTDNAVRTINSRLLDVGLGYVNRYPDHFKNADSVDLAMRLSYADGTRSAELIELSKKFVDRYLQTDRERLDFAYGLVQRHFRDDILKYAESLASQCIARAPSALAYLVRALSNERRNNLCAAEANLQLAYDVTDDIITESVLNEYQKMFAYRAEKTFADGVNPNSGKSGRSDGRFTLGAGSTRLMYGFPIPESTSHFVVNINGKLASNAAHLGSQVAYLAGKISYEGDAATPRVIVQYEFEKIRFRQVLTPVDREGNEIKRGFAQYYQITYQFDNATAAEHRIGLLLLFDTMMGDNDYCAISAAARDYPKEVMLTGSLIPPTLQFYRTPRDTSDTMGEAVLRGLRATPPQRLLIGRWPVLHQLQWKLKYEPVPFGDSAYMLQWENQPLTAFGKMELTTYYGLPANKEPQLQAVMKGEVFLTRHFSIYFDHNEDQLDLNAKMMVSELASDSNIEIRGVLLNGYADITGDADFNMELSRRRIRAVAEILAAFHIPSVPKPYGVDGAARSPYDAIYGNAWDRRVEAVVYYRLRRSSVVTAAN